MIIYPKFQIFYLVKISVFFFSAKEFFSWLKSTFWEGGKFFSKEFFGWLTGIHLRGGYVQFKNKRRHFYHFLLLFCFYKPTVRFEGHTNWIKCCEILENNKILVSGSSDNTLISWNCDTGEILHNFIGHEDTITCCALSYMDTNIRI